MFVPGSLKRSEFDIQSDICNRIKLLGMNIRGEVHGTVQGKKTGNSMGNKVRLDLVIFDANDLPRLVIEVKMKRGNAWRADYIKSQQYMMYSLLDLPVIMVCGKAEADSFMAQIDMAITLPNGVHWVA